MQEKTVTPWGVAQDHERIADGIDCYSTASHGGVHLSLERMAAVPACFRRIPHYCGEEAWFEEDCEWALVALTFPEHFTKQQEVARCIVEYTYPEAWKEFTK